MIKFRFLILLILMVPITTNAQRSEEFTNDWIAAQEGKNFLDRQNFVESQEYSFYDLVYQRMEWNVDPAVRYISGEVTSYFVCTTDSLHEMTFDLNDNMIIDSILQEKQKVSFLHQNDKITIQLKDRMLNHQMDSVSIYYRGEPINTDFGSFSTGQHNGIPVMWTLSEPYGAKDWWPCKQSLKDKIDSIDIIVSTPESFRTASNGILVSDLVAGGIREMHWKHRFPIATYLVAIAVTNYASYSDFLDLGEGRRIEILNYIYPEDLEYARSNTPEAVDIMQLFNYLIGEYPFSSEKYGHAQFGWNGGMEHQTMSFMGHFDFNIIAHELAHQWFGDYITLGSWQDIWLNEGFATYLTGLAFENLLGDDYWLAWKKYNVGKITATPSGSVFVTDTTDVSRIFDNRLSYSKGAYLLHMLRWILGDENFFSGLQNYFNNPEIANGFARTRDFKEQMEMAGDTSLTEFFNDWFYGEGFPVYSVNFSNFSPGICKIILSQTPSDESVDFFEMPVPIRIYNFDKTDSADLRLNNTENDQEFFVNTDFEVADLKVDPDYWLVNKTNTIVYSPLDEVNSEIQIYPNPFIDKLNVFGALFQKSVQIKIYSLDGKLIKEFSNGQNTYNLLDINSGIYLLKIYTEHYVFIRKIIKQ